MNGDTPSGWSGITNLIAGVGQAAGSVLGGLRGNVTDLTKQANGSAAPSNTNWTPWLIGAGVIAVGLVLLGVLRRG